MIKGILFDKDGTLIDFFSLWLGAAKAVVIQFLKENELSEEVKERVFYAMGIENGEIDPYGGLRISPIQKLLWILRMNFQGSRFIWTAEK